MAVFPVESESNNADSNEEFKFKPVLRSASYAAKGSRQYMEDEHVCIDDLSGNLSSQFPSPVAFYGIFDGHHGANAAKYARENLLRFILQDENFPDEAERAVGNSFTRTDDELLHAGIVSSGTTALVALVWGNTLIVANAGDCRAVLGRLGNTVDLSTDHKPADVAERSRIESLGGTVSETGYLNGEIGVSRSLGDWQLKLRWGHPNPLIAEAEVRKIPLTEKHDFLVMASDGLWDVITSESAERIVRRELVLHNDLAKCCEVLVNEALKRNTTDNVTAVIVCFSPHRPPRKQFANSRLRKDSWPPLLASSLEAKTPLTDLNALTPHQPMEDLTKVNTCETETHEDQHTDVPGGTKSSAKPQPHEDLNLPVDTTSPDSAENRPHEAPNLSVETTSPDSAKTQPHQDHHIPSGTTSSSGSAGETESAPAVALTLENTSSDGSKFPDDKEGHVNESTSPLISKDDFDFAGEKIFSTPSLNSDISTINDEENFLTSSLPRQFSGTSHETECCSPTPTSSSCVSCIKEFFKCGCLRPLLGGVGCFAGRK